MLRRSVFSQGVKQSLMELLQERMSIEEGLTVVDFCEEISSEFEKFQKFAKDQLKVYHGSVNLESKKQSFESKDEELNFNKILDDYLDSEYPKNLTLISVKELPVSVIFTLRGLINFKK